MYCIHFNPLSIFSFLWKNWNFLNNNTAKSYYPFCLPSKSLSLLKWLMSNLSIINITCISPDIHLIRKNSLERIYRLAFLPRLTLRRKLMKKITEKKIAFQTFIFSEYVLPLAFWYTYTDNFCIKKWFTRKDATEFALFHLLYYYFFCLEFLHNLQTIHIEFTFLML